MLIRPATHNDVPVLVDFQTKMALETENVTLDRLILTQGVEALFQHPSRGMYYVAEDQSGVIACLMTTFEWSDWRNGTILWIQSVYVTESFRRKGVFEQMYSFVRSLVEQDRALKGIRLYVDISNTSAQVVYKKSGMNGEHYRVYEWMRS